MATIGYGRSTTATLSFTATLGATIAFTFTRVVERCWITAANFLAPMLWDVFVKAAPVSGHWMLPAAPLDEGGRSLTARMRAGARAFELRRLARDSRDVAAGLGLQLAV